MVVGSGLVFLLVIGGLVWFLTRKKDSVKKAKQEDASPSARAQDEDEFAEDGTERHYLKLVRFP